MLTAIKNFQKRSKAKVTGTLTPAERASLIAAAKEHEQEFGWSVVVDPATGVRIGLPTKLLPHARDAARGTRWSSAHGEVQVETFRIKNAGLTLAALFEQEKKQPSTRKVEGSALHDDNFFVSGMQGLKYFSVRAQLRDGEVRGFTVLYDQMMEGIVAPVMGPMAAAFSPFPERSAPFAAPAKTVEYGTGLIVSSNGHIVTARRLTQGCQVIVAAGLGDADRVADDPESGLALLRVYGAHKVAPLSLTQCRAQAGRCDAGRHLRPEGAGRPQGLTEIKARLTDGAAIELRQPVPMAGFSGAAALDAQRPIPRHDRDAHPRARECFARTAAGAAYPGAYHPRLSRGARSGRDAGARRRRQGVDRQNYLRAEIVKPRQHRRQRGAQSAPGWPQERHSRTIKAGR